MAVTALSPGVVRLALGAALALPPAVAAASGSTTAPSDLLAWVDRLAAADPADRIAAERHLGTAGSRAIPVLTAALDDPRPEVSARARSALRRVRLFALRTGENLDPALALADRYLSLDAPASRAAIVQQLAALNPRPADVLVRLTTLEPNAGLRAQLFAATAPNYRAAVPRLLAEGDAAALPPLLELAMAGVPSLGIPDYAVERQLTGHMDDAVARWRAERLNGGAPRQALAAGVLCALYRAAGQPDAAADAARQSKDWRLILSTAMDRGDWPAARAAAGSWPGGKGAPFRAALDSLAGAAPEPVLRSLAADAAADAIPVAKLHLLLGDVDGGLARLSQDPAQGGDPIAAFRLRQARGEYDAALALADRFARHPVVGTQMTALSNDLRRLLGELPPTPTTPPAPPDAEPLWATAVADLSAHHYAETAAVLAPGDTDPARTDWWYVRGYALSAASDAGHGQSLMRAAALAPLADGAARARLADRLSDAGLDAPAAEQRALAVRVASPFHDPAALLDLHLSREAAATAAHDYATAAAAADRVWLLGFWPGLTWPQPLPYLTVPADVHLARARLARSRDDWPAALAELGSYRTFLPTSADIPLEWVPLLDARGEHAAADAMFAAAFDPLDAESARHPRSPYLHNQCAWLAACCCRRLDAALAHAEAAVRLAPADWQYVDTLAEVRFRLGDRPASVGLERRAATLAGHDAAYVARQLARFARAEVPSTTRPADAPN